MLNLFEFATHFIYGTKKFIFAEFLSFNEKIFTRSFKLILKCFKNC